MIVGIDPGVTGGIAFLNVDLELYLVVDMPTMPLNDKKLQVNGAEVAKLLNSVEVNHVYIERVHAMTKPGEQRQGVAASFNFGMGFGVVQGVCAGLMIPYSLVNPEQWKKRAGVLKMNKDYCRTIAQQLYPGADLSKKIHSGRADALLIARYGGQ